MKGSSWLFSTGMRWARDVFSVPLFWSTPGSRSWTSYISCYLWRVYFLMEKSDLVCWQFSFHMHFFFQLCIRIVSPLYNLINVMKHEGEIVWVTCEVSVVCLWALILDMTCLEETEEGSSLCPVPDGQPSWNLLLLPRALLSRVYFQY